MLRFHLAPDDQAGLAFACSPLLEAVLSLHVLVAPRHHPLQTDWVRSMRRLPAPLKREIAELAFLYRHTQLNCLLPGPAGGDEDFATELARFRALPADVAGLELIRVVHDHGGAKTWDEVTRDPRARRRAPRIVRDPAGMRDRFADLLEAYWDRAFAGEWERLEPLLADGVRVAGEQIARDGVYAFLLRLRPPLVVDPAAATFGLDVPHEHELAIDAATPLVLVPSVYVWPHVVVNCDAPWPAALVFRAPHLVERRRAAAADLVPALRALGDPTRLRMLELIAERPRTTTELAPLVALSEAGTSKHLRVLAAAGLVTTRRDGYYVLYALARESFGALADDVRRLGGAAEAAPPVSHA